MRELNSLEMEFQIAGNAYLDGFCCGVGIGLCCSGAGSILGALCTAYACAKALC